VKKLSACITSECGSFIAAICRQTRQLISSHSGSNRSQTSAASFVGSPSSFDLGTTRRLFRNRERAKSAWVWVARATSPSSLSFPFLHPPSPLCARLKGIRKYPRSAHTHKTWPCIRVLRNSLHQTEDTSTFSMTYRLATLPPPPLDLDAVITATSYRSTLARRPARTPTTHSDNTHKPRLLTKDCSI
jgi:hypothetical protein